MYPTFNLEKSYIKKGHSFVCGMDEAGRGAWAGPLIVGAAIFNTHEVNYKLRDSKKISEKKRFEAYSRLIKDLLDFSIGYATPSEIDEHGLTEASRIAAKRCLLGLNFKPDIVLLDGKHNYLDDTINSTTIISGDSKVSSITAAGIIAKVTRDQILKTHHEYMPHYSLNEHKGYGTKEHKKAIDIHGPSHYHRKSFNMGGSWGNKK